MKALDVRRNRVVHDRWSIACGPSSPSATPCTSRFGWPRGCATYADKKLKVIERALLGAQGRFAMRVTHFDVEMNHLHLIVETIDKNLLRRAITGFNVRLARGLNKVTGRSGQVIGERYHAHILKTPAEVRNAINYVLENYLKHRSAVEYNSLVRPDLVVRPTVWLLTKGPQVTRGSPRRS